LHSVAREITRHEIAQADGCTGAGEEEDRQRTQIVECAEDTAEQRADRTIAAVREPGEGAMVGGIRLRSNASMEPTGHDQHRADDEHAHGEGSPQASSAAPGEYGRAAPPPYRPAVLRERSGCHAQFKPAQAERELRKRPQRHENHHADRAGGAAALRCVVDAIQPILPYVGVIEQMHDTAGDDHDVHQQIDADDDRRYAQEALRQADLKEEIECETGDEQNDRQNELFIPVFAEETRQCGTDRFLIRCDVFRHMFPERIVYHMGRGVGVRERAGDNEVGADEAEQHEDKRFAEPTLDEAFEQAGRSLAMRRTADDMRVNRHGA